MSLIAGPCALPTPPGVDRIDVETARQMADAVDAALPADAAIMVAAVADWRTEGAAQKIKKQGGRAALKLIENPDILAGVGARKDRPRLLIGFAAETEKVIDHATAKLDRKGADWIVANDVSGPPGQSVMGGDANTVHIVSKAGVESWERMDKSAVADALADRIADALA